MVPIKGFSNYFITENGEVFSNNRKGVKLKKLKPQLNKYGYPNVTLCKGEYHKLCSIHRLVATAFIPNPKNKPQINHKDGNKTNNYVSNLEWCTASENLKHSYRILKREPPKGNLGKPGLKGENSPSAKAIKQFTKDGKFIAEYPALSIASKETGIYRTSISKCALGHRPSAGGFVWKYTYKGGKS